MYNSNIAIDTVPVSEKDCILNPTWLGKCEKWFPGLYEVTLGTF